jgi:toxin FitB
MTRPTLVDCMAARKDEDLSISSLTFAEIWRGILETPKGRRRAALEAWFLGAEGPAALFAGRILAFDDRADLIRARLNGRRKGFRSPA